MSSQYSCTKCNRVFKHKRDFTRHVFDRKTPCIINEREMFETQQKLINTSLHDLEVDINKYFHSPTDELQESIKATLKSLRVKRRIPYLRCTIDESISYITKLIEDHKDNYEDDKALILSQIDNQSVITEGITDGYITEGYSEEDE